MKGSDDREEGEVFWMCRSSSVATFQVPVKLTAIVHWNVSSSSRIPPLDGQIPALLTRPLIFGVSSRMLLNEFWTEGRDETSVEG